MKEFSAVELRDLEGLTAKAIRGEMVEADFERFGEIFRNVKKDQYIKFINKLVPNLSDDALHQLTAGLLDYQAKNLTETNTFLRKDDIIKGLVIEECNRHGFRAEMTKEGMKIPETVPDAILSHYKIILEKHPNVFHSSDGKLNIVNIHTNINFNLFNTLVLNAASAANLNPLEEMAALTSAQQNASKLTKNVEEKITLENEKIIVKAGALNLSKVQKIPESEIDSASKSAVEALQGSVSKTAEKKETKAHKERKVRWENVDKELSKVANKIGGSFELLLQAMVNLIHWLEKKKSHTKSKPADIEISGPVALTDKEPERVGGKTQKQGFTRDEREHIGPRREPMIGTKRGKSVPQEQVETEVSTTRTSKKPLPTIPTATKSKVHALVEEFEPKKKPLPTPPKKPIVVEGAQGKASSMKEFWEKKTREEKAAKDKSNSKDLVH